MNMVNVALLGEIVGNKEAAEMGYRLIDTAQGYGNEDEVGQALRQAGPAADELFLVTKLHHTTHGRDQVHAQLRESLEKLGRSSVDLYLIHNPKGGMLLETWAAMLEAKRQGLALAAVAAARLQHVREDVVGHSICERVREFRPSRRVAIT